ncbi:MAG: hypothetical protein M0Z85_10335 [Gammaproteobacteria bacterium]|nr:hypothetical protein [Gammaproteobacteria bacterium]MDA8192057.1 hypothetical protein [Gammaproteobacteria bacterium]
MANRTPPAASGAIAAIAAACALLALGFAGYTLYLHVGALFAKGRSLPAPLVLGLAVIGGAASFFSPCSIAITPAFLAYLTAGPPPDGRSGHRPSASLVSAAILVATGIVGFYVAAGAIVGVIGSTAYNDMIYLVPFVGLAFLLLGALILLGASGRLAFIERWNPMNRVYARQEASAAGISGKRTLISFGFAYGAASHTCSLPVFLGILLVPLVAGHFALAALAVIIYGFAIAFLVVAMMVLGQRVFAALRRLGPWMMRATAVLFLGSGIFLLHDFGENYGAYLHAPSNALAPTAPPIHHYQLTEGAGTTGYPYAPRTLHIPARETVAVVVSDHVGGCLLRTIFEGLGPNGRKVSVTVPVGKTRMAILYAPRPGRYPFHCGGHMYSGTIVAR